MVRRWLSVLLLAFVLLTGCGKDIKVPVVEKETEPVQDEVVHLSIATSGNWEGILRGELIEKYCDKVREWSDGTLDIKMYYNGVLGNDTDLAAGAKNGTLSIINCVPSYQTTIVPEAALLDTPGLFNSIEEFNEFIEGDYADTIQNYYQKRGIRLLSSKAFCYRVLTSRFRVSSMEDFQGLRMRTMENQYQVLFWQSLGCTVTPMNFSGVRVAMQQNILEAQENPLGYMFSSNLQDVQGYVLKTNHMLMVSSYLMNEERYQELSDEHKAILARFFDEMEAELIEKQQEEETKQQQTLESKGYVFTDANDEIRQGIAEGRDIVLERLRKTLGDQTVDEFLNALEKSRG